MIPNEDLERQHRQAARLSRRLSGWPAKSGANPGKQEREDDETKKDSQWPPRARRLRSLAARRRAARRDIKIGVLNDRRALCRPAGEGSVIAARMAVEDFGAAEQGHHRRDRLGRPPEQARRRPRTSRASGIDEDGVDVIVDVPTSSVALAVNEIVREKNKVFISGAATSDLTGRPARPTPSTGPTTPGRSPTAPARDGGGGRRQLVLPHRRLRLRPCARARHLRGRRGGAGGKVVGTVRHPFPGQDFSSFLLQAQASGAKVIGLANAGGDTINSIKQAAEFGITQGGQALAGLLVFITDVHALGLRRRRAWC
jgi:branched-chain amino acid transport system substrate-binding protein